MNDKTAASRPGVAAFDFDGTLVQGDSLTPFITRLLGRRRFAAVLSSSAPAMAMGYRREGRDGAKTALLRKAVVDLESSYVEMHGEDFAASLTRRVRTEMRSKIEWHRSAGHRLVLVSASLTAYLEPLGQLLGFDNVIASQLEIDAVTGLLTGRLLGDNVRGPVKALRLNALLDSAPAGNESEVHDATKGARRSVELWAYGDSPGDREMLAMADHAHLVDSPAARLRLVAARAASIMNPSRSASGSECC